MGYQSFYIHWWPIEVWLDCFDQCHHSSGSGYKRTCWPDGGAYIDQANVTVSIFGIIRDELTLMLVEQRKRSESRGR